MGSGVLVKGACKVDQQQSSGNPFARNWLVVS